MAPSLLPARRWADDVTVEMLLGGSCDPESLPESLAPVGRLLGAAAAPATYAEMADRQALVPRLAELARAEPPSGVTPLAPRRRARAIAAVAVAGAVGLSATGVAAASGSLPDPVQGLAHDVLAGVRIEVPDADAPPDGTPSEVPAAPPTTAPTTSGAATPGTDGGRVGPSEANGSPEKSGHAAPDPSGKPQDQPNPDRAEKAQPNSSRGAPTTTPPTTAAPKASASAGEPGRAAGDHRPAGTSP